MKKSTKTLGAILTSGVFAAANPSWALAAAPDMAADQKGGQVTVVLASPVSIPRNLSWNEAALNSARQIIANQKSDLLSAIRNLKQNGSTQIHVVYGKQSLSSPAFRDTMQYGTKFLPWHLEGYPLDPQLMTTEFPLDQVDMANYLTKLKNERCSLVDFSIWTLETWFQPEPCSVTTPSPEEFLRASLATALKKSTIDIGSFELAQLKTAMAPESHTKISNGNLICLELGSVFAGKTAIPLSFRSPVGGYEISVNLSSRTAVFRFIGPDLKVLAAHAYRNEGENFIRFFASQAR